MVEVRPAVPEEAEALARLQLDCWRDAYADLVDPARLQPYLDDVAGNVARWASILAGPGRVLVAQDGDALVGFATVRPPDGGAPAHLAAIYTRASHWSSGLGQRLLDAGLGDAPATLRVFRDNDRAVRFYARNGFVPDGYEAEEPHFGGIEIGMVRPAP